MLQKGLAGHMASLERHLEAVPFEQRMELAVVAILAAACAAACSQQKVADGPPPRIVEEAAAVLTALCQVAVNGVAVVPPIVCSHADRLGVALYPLASLLNHSCSPNVSMTFEVQSLTSDELQMSCAGT